MSNKKQNKQRLPISLDKQIIKEVVVEIRFNSDFTSDKLLDKFYPSIIKILKDVSIVPLPILQIPDQVRLFDINLKYQPCYKFENNNFSIGIGNRSLIFICSSDYIGWDKLSNLIFKVTGDLLEKKIIEEIERCSIRYVNVLEESFIDVCNIEVKIQNEELKTENLHLRTEIKINDALCILQLTNNIVENHLGIMLINASVIDIDCINIQNEKLANFDKTYKGVFNDLHNVAKEILFNRLLKTDYLKSLNPKY